MISNMRDLGGIPAAGGKMIKPGMLVRSAHLAEAEEEDLNGISAVIDLRTPGEAKEKPDRCFGAEYIPMAAHFEDAAGFVRDDDAPDPPVPEMGTLYRMAALNLSGYFSEALKAIISHDFSSGAILFHCSAGKDRTGVITALVLMLLGVSRGEIVKDYLKTNVAALPVAEEIRAKLIGEKGEAYASAVYRACIADESYLNAALEVFDDDYLNGLGIGEEALEAFRRTVLG